MRALGEEEEERAGVAALATSRDSSGRCRELELNVRTEE